MTMLYMQASICRNLFELDLLVVIKQPLWNDSSSPGWWLSMKTEDCFLNRLQPLSDFERLMSKNERFGEYNEKTIGCLVVRHSRQHLNDVWPSFHDVGELNFSTSNLEFCDFRCMLSFSHCSNHHGQKILGIRQTGLRSLKVSSWGKYSTPQDSTLPFNRKLR